MAPSSKFGPGQRSCPACGEIYDSETGAHLPERHPDHQPGHDEVAAVAGQSWGEIDGDR